MPALVALGYPAYTVRLSATFPLEDVAHFDDELAFWAYGNRLVSRHHPILALFRTIEMTA
jgi:hypothetical protein